jgi:hypothetical protein
MRGVRINLKCSKCGGKMTKRGPLYVRAEGHDPIKTKHAILHCEACDRWVIVYSVIEGLLRACVGKIPTRKQLLVRLPAPILELFKIAMADRGTTANAFIADYIAETVADE